MYTYKTNDNDVKQKSFVSIAASNWHTTETDSVLPGIILYIYIYCVQLENDCQHVSHGSCLLGNRETVRTEDDDDDDDDECRLRMIANVPFWISVDERSCIDMVKPISCYTIHCSAFNLVQKLVNSKWKIRWKNFQWWNSSYTFAHLLVYNLEKKTY